MVFDDEKNHFMPLTEYYHYQLGRVSESTSLSYLNALEPFFYWLKTKSLFQGERILWDSSVLAVKSAIKQYLQKELGCKVRDQDSYEKVFLTNKSKKTVNHFLAAIKAFYKAMIKLGLYEHGNPLVNLDLIEQDFEIPGERKGRQRMPKIAGTEEPVNYRKITESYFKIMKDEWIPEVIGDWDLPYKVYNAGEKSNWTLRDEVIIRFLFETGARISEILDLTIGDYRNRMDKHELSAFNKGSFRRRTKFVRISPETLKLLIRYINTERRKSAKNQVKFESLSDNDFIFISQRGDQYKYNAFYNHWHKIISTSGMKLNIHKARHWFVTSRLRGIYETSTSKAEIEDKKKQLIGYMKWRDSETINIYEHLYDEEKYRDIHEQMIQTYTRREKEYLKNKKTNKDVPASKIVSIQDKHFEEEWLNDFYEGME
ncbi:site-specific integrase [Paenibacillus sp. KQZ6P-2]|uniref:Site-specific integrase n=1 Tax=Paenibacillus mangrovi TaxID=2931978 RepID=A0A9X1WNU0_9BACL|nr:site-specific integrase [Paenibacillus mangrovi]MCJ8012338.1 site-specific integrase [Paenibacillus mangrovi]